MSVCDVCVLFFLFMFVFVFVLVFTVVFVFVFVFVFILLLVPCVVLGVRLIAMHAEIYKCYFDLTLPVQ